jgi:hypothetical protein
MPDKALVVGANILVRAILGCVVFRPELAYAEAEDRLPALVLKRGGGPKRTLAFLRCLATA